MKTVVYSAHKFEQEYLVKANNHHHELIMLEVPLTEHTVSLAAGCKAVSVFVTDKGSAEVIYKLAELGIHFITLRSAGYNHIDLLVARKMNIRIARVPAYSPYAVAEHAVALMLALNRRLVHAHNRINELNFSLNGLTGFDMNGKIAGVIGTGQIGSVVVKILHGFGCKIIAHDAIENDTLKKDFGVEYVDSKTLYNQADVITLHVPLNEETKYIINKDSIRCMKPGVMLINTSRGALVNTKEVIDALKSGHVGYLGMDVYEEEEGLFFEDHSQDILQDDMIARLMSFRNVLITSHQAFLTDTALKNIADTTIYNLDCFEKEIVSGNELDTL
ncbi:MAG: 2-hydroxyacid dehydrogenase [Bacteroidota bacterium]|nr:2-hydroxyacid dehydrogenase [Saprospiraceae bacterium]MDZ4807988.1 2-hydroxyacid dehydrogenase [Bacteroidota bacterium]